MHEVTSLESSSKVGVRGLEQGLCNSLCQRGLSTEAHIQVLQIIILSVLLNIQGTSQATNDLAWQHTSLF